MQCIVFRVFLSPSLPTLVSFPSSSSSLSLPICPLPLSTGTRSFSGCSLRIFSPLPSPPLLPLPLLGSGPQACRF